ncbi:MAG: DNA repair protein RecO [Abditibacteriales bacterium]|nr:DNA repair protein RecO [Abditibacteriales bacterium]MDW8365271.1 DNA repair protein RecO [Abditibacteriales bacterium]
MLDSRTRTYNVTAVVLRSRPLGEKDRVVVLFSREAGKLDAVAKGARQPKSKLAAGTQPFTLARFALARGRTLQVVTQCVIEESFYALHEDLSKIAWGAYVLELMDAATPPHQHDEALFDLLVSTLRWMGATDDPELVTRAFELRLLNALGYAPALTECAVCGRTVSDSLVAFSARWGGALCAADAAQRGHRGKISQGTLRTAAALSGSKGDALQRLRLTPQVRTELRGLMNDFLTQRLEVRLKAREFLVKVME